MTQYRLSVWHDEDCEVDVSGDEMQRVVAQVDTFNKELEPRGVGVRRRAAPRVVGDRAACGTGDDVSMTDGPYAESKEQMGGFWVIEASNLDAALAWARKAAVACESPVELRPFQDG